MQQAERDISVHQAVTWYLVQAGKGGHTDTGEAEDKDDLKKQWVVFTRYMSDEFRSRSFKDIGTIDMQVVVDEAAASGSEKAASRLREIFSSVDKFAVQMGVISARRTKRLLAPLSYKKPRPLDDAAFKRTWEALLYCGNGGAPVDRGPCLAILTSGVTLQPLGNLISMRRDEVDFERKLWSYGDPKRYVHLSDLALDLISKAIALGDLTHREVKTDFVFPSGGPKRDPARPVSYSLTHEVVQKNVDKLATPQDLRETGIASLKALGGEELKALVKAISKGGSEAVPDAMQIALTEGWAERIQDLTKRTWS